MFKRFSSAVLPLVFSLFAACGAAHVQLNVPPANPQDFRTVQIGAVSVTSPEESATDNVELQAKLSGWQHHAASELSRVAAQCGQRIAPGPVPPAPLTLTLLSEVRYGNRFLRWFVGFGAGKGSVRSTLMATDTRSGSVRFEAVAESDLSMGAFGGDIDKVFHENITELLEQYEQSLSTRT